MHFVVVVVIVLIIFLMLDYYNALFKIALFMDLVVVMRDRVSAVEFLGKSDRLIISIRDDILITDLVFHFRSAFYH